ncbi:MAG: hypothetical protein AAFU53_02225, partial [Cyanobacteria bacterium J06632_3]
SVVLTPNGEPDPSGELPFIAIATSLTPISPAQQATDIADYSAYLLRNTEGFENAVVIEQQPVMFAEGDGYFLKATSEEDVILQYLSIQRDNNYIRMVVVGSQTEIERLLPSIESIQRSIVMN